MERRIELRADRSDRSAYFLSARMKPDGSLVIEGQDLGDAPEAFWGSREYEWAITIAPGDVPSFVAALSGTAIADDPLELLGARFRQDERFATRAFLEEGGIPFRFWSRIGD